MGKLYIKIGLKVEIKNLKLMEKHIDRNDHTLADKLFRFLLGD
jgi:hypothetical protein